MPSRSAWHRVGNYRRHIDTILILGLATVSLDEVYADQDFVQFETPDGQTVEITNPDAMGFSDIASLFPFSGPFAPDDDGPGDRVLHNIFGSIDPGFAQQLLPVIQSRYPKTNDHPCFSDVSRLCPHSDAAMHCLGINSGKLSPECREEIKNAVPFVCSKQIKRWCDDNLDQGIIPCLEDHGADLPYDCANAIVATRQAISSLGAGLTNPKGRSNSDSSSCPSGFKGPQRGGCCIRRWTRSCDQDCSRSKCDSTPGWSWQWVDFRTFPYTCCPNRIDVWKKYIGGQTMCPSGWKIEKTGEERCCSRPWSWDCGASCAEAQCTSIGFAWRVPGSSRKPFRCCPGPVRPSGLMPIAGGAGDPKDQTPSKAPDQTISQSNTAAKDNYSAMDLSAFGIDSQAQPMHWLVLVLVVACGVKCCRAGGDGGGAKEL